jgi:hypothetical protein
MLVLGGVLLLSGCVSERHYIADTAWPFGNPNAPAVTSETAERAVGRTPDVAPIVPQPGDVWPSGVMPMPTLSDIQKDANLPLGQAFTPSLPSPYPPGEAPVDPTGTVPALGEPTAPSAALPPVPAVPGDAR